MWFEESEKKITMLYYIPRFLSDSIPVPKINKTKGVDIGLTLPEYRYKSFPNMDVFFADIAIVEHTCYFYCSLEGKNLYVNTTLQIIRLQKMIDEYSWFVGH